MYDTQLTEMTEKIAKELGITDKSKVAKIYSALTNYWSDKVAIVWTMSDIASLDCAEGLSDEDLINILDDLRSSIDATVGITWDTIEIAVNEYKSKCNTD